MKILRTTFEFSRAQGQRSLIACVKVGPGDEPGIMVKCV